MALVDLGPRTMTDAGGPPLRGAPVVEVQHPAETFSSHHRSAFVRRFGGCDDELVLESLMVPLNVVVRHELRHCPSEVAFAQRDDLPQALRLDRQDEPRMPLATFLKAHLGVLGAVKTKSRSLPGEWQEKQVRRSASPSGLPSVNWAKPQPPVVAYFFEPPNCSRHAIWSVVGERDRPRVSGDHLGPGNGPDGRNVATSPIAWSRGP